MIILQVIVLLKSFNKNYILNDNLLTFLNPDKVLSGKNLSKIKMKI